MQSAVRPFPKHCMSSYRVLVRFLVCTLLVVLSASVAAAQEFGTLSIRARPAGAEILIDGEHWTGSGETGPLQVQLPLNVSLSVAVPRPEPPPAPAPPRPQSAAGPLQPGRVVEVSDAGDGGVFAPAVKLTEGHQEFDTLVGTYG